MVHSHRRAPTLPLWQPRILFSTNQPVSYLPSQTTPDSGTSSLNFRSSPWKLLAADIKLVFTLLLWVPYIFLPWRSTNVYSELYPSWKNMRDLGLHVVLCLLGFIWLIIVIPIWLAAPGLAFALFMLFYCALTVLFCVPLDCGPRVVRSRIQHVNGREIRDDENWVFVNGVAAGNHWLQANVDMISEIFGRPVIGIHNRTYGTVFDLVECLVQRCFSYATKDTRVLYDHLKSVLLDNNIRKCVVIAHSQGGIILSTALDSLFADVPSGAFEKMEIYTFGCAANHFNNPIRFVPSSFQQQTPLTNPQAPEERLIKHIEHYCNEHDFVARFGALHFAKDKLSNRFVGKVFENKGHGGHLLNQHYLDLMFAGDSSDFLDMVVEVEEDKAAARAQVASNERTQEEPRAARTWPPARTDFRMASVEVPGDLEQIRTLGRSIAVPAPGTGWDFSTAARVRASAEMQRGRTVRELSRFWRYKDGKSPD
ncbi:hypothetical protein L873DRAFT_1845397 [Choiromyces venosus 120613-1]|uniref:DUF676 domain-containing protein n=1 Tax=Choiromyces venosus 120613-1 TaxID=1336337 RepID=A0A3N4JDX2_9PEZI|nr:hypothetical protein L873DRAFT_1845397 [Choiromyces venosus 120613-1]